MKRKLKYNIPIQIICASLFAIFSFLYIYLFQGELLALLQDHLSKGATSNNALGTAVIVTLLLMCVQWGVNRLSKLHGGWVALSYMPSCVLLALFTAIDGDTVHYSLAKWIWGVSICMLLYVFIVWVERRVISLSRPSFPKILWPNMMTLAFLFAVTAQVGNHASALHMELAAWKHLHGNDYEAMLKVGNRSDDYNMGLTTLRNLAMLKTGTLSEQLFCYPQHYGAEGLIYHDDERNAENYSAKEFYNHLGVQPNEGETGIDFSQRIYATVDSVAYRDWYFAALLLDKELDVLASELEVIVQEWDTLPTYYQEALLLYNAQHPEAPIAFVPDADIVANYEAYCQLQQDNTDNYVVARNKALSQFGKTYWAYYDYWAEE